MCDGAMMHVIEMRYDTITTVHFNFTPAHNRNCISLTDNLFCVFTRKIQIHAHIGIEEIRRRNPIEFIEVVKINCHLNGTHVNIKSQSNWPRMATAAEKTFVFHLIWIFIDTGLPHFVLFEILYFGHFSFRCDQFEFWMKKLRETHCDNKINTFCHGPFGPHFQFGTRREMICY